MSIEISTALHNRPKVSSLSLHFMNSSIHNWVNQADRKEIARCCLAIGFTSVIGVSKRTLSKLFHNLGNLHRTCRHPRGKRRKSSCRRCIGRPWWLIVWSEVYKKVWVIVCVMLEDLDVDGEEQREAVRRPLYILLLERICRWSFNPLTSPADSTH